MTPHDGELSATSSVHFEDGLVVIEGEYASNMEDTVALDAREALSLLVWLTHNREALEFLSERQQTS